MNTFSELNSSDEIITKPLMTRHERVNMISVRQKWITILICFLLLILCSGFSLFREGGQKQEVTAIQDMKGKALGGVKAKMPDSSVKIFFESIYGVKFSEYRSYRTIQDAVTALKNHAVQGIWVSDVTSGYLLGTDTELAFVDAGANGGVGVYSEQTPKSREERMQFAFAFRPEDERLRDKCNGVLTAIKQDGRLDELLMKYRDGKVEAPAKYEDMLVNSSTYNGVILDDPLYIGISGSVPPLECVDEYGTPYGFCVELADTLGLLLNRKIRFLVLNSETIFSELMGGRIDMVFCYGTSENHSTEFPEYIMSDGYCPMQGYQMLTLK